MSQAMAIESGNRVLKDRGNVSDIVTVAGGDRPITATSEQADNAAGYKAIVVYDEGHEHVGIEALEWADATTSKAVNMENSTGVVQANTGVWKSTVALKPTVDRAAIDPKVKSAGQLGVAAAQNSKVQGVQNAKAGEGNVQQFAHEKEKVSVVQEKRPTLSPGELIEKPSDTKSNNWTMVNKSPSKKQTPSLQNQIVPSKVIGVSKSFDALVNEDEHAKKEAKNKEQQMDDESQSVAGKTSSTAMMMNTTPKNKQP
nr:uncharacterized protein LOC108948139 [Nicotiana tomentosiformis]